MSVKHTYDIEALTVEAGTSTTMQVLISAEEGPHFAMHRFVMHPAAACLITPTW
jgi:hypothetical protein